MGEMIFITGTDTNVGKTVIAAALGAFWVEQGRRVGAVKPFESGEPLRSDSRFLQATIPLSQTLDEVNLYAFPEAIAPGIAAERAGLVPDLDRVCAHIRAMAARFDVLLVEGAGGIFVPISKSANGQDVMIKDLILELGCAVLVIGRSGLGTINHSLLTLSELRRQKSPVQALILNQTESAVDLSAADNRAILARHTDVPVLGPFPHLPCLSRDALILAGREVFGSLSQL